jgi:hexosaminidase
MFRPVFIFKVLILSLIVNFVLVVYFLCQNTHNTSLTDKTDSYDEVNDYYSIYENLPQSTNVKIMPIPMYVIIEHTKILLLNKFRLVSTQKPSKDLELALVRYSKYISSLTGLTVHIDKSSSSSSSQNALIIDCPSIQSKKNKYPKLNEDESYALNVTKTGVYLNAVSLTGVIRGLSTFVQLIERDSTSENSYIPLANIVDRPRFPWRGLMLDVSRHWMPVPVIERTLNAMEMSKLNVLHLSDDQGFRVESLQHPLLHDRQDYFTQKDIRHLVEFARQRRIRIIPEFDIPGHTTR